MSCGIRFDYSLSGIDSTRLTAILPEIEKAHIQLHEGTGQGSEYTGWLDFPLHIKTNEIEEINHVSQEIRENADVFILIGIGGSYLGARAAIEFLHSPFYNKMATITKKGPEIYYLGNNVSPIYIEKILEFIKGKSIYLNVISKSGTTLEPALSFRIMKKMMEETYGKEEARKRIIVTTDKEKGALKKLSWEEGYRTFVVPGNIGGRYSVLSAVGLLPIAVSGVNIQEIIQGAVDGYQAYQSTDLALNDCYQYAAVRNLLYRDNKNIELLVNYEPSLNSFAEWWKQLFGESEGKDHKGIFPASVSFTTDLHSIGQYIQDGQRNLFTTTLWIENTGTSLQVPHVPEDVDGLSYLEGMPFEEINHRACQGTMQAHVNGGVPNLKITIPALTPYYYGQLVYFFLKACGISGYLLGVNPFDQPGVEEYKKNMYSLLRILDESFS